MGILDGRVAIVTGAGKGIGFAEAQYLAALGASVVVNDIGGTVTGCGHDPAVAEAAVTQIVSTGGTAVANCDDISDWAGASGLVEQAIDTYGHLDIVVNNAGILRLGPILDLGEGDWDALMRVHARGTFAMISHAGRYWQAEYKSHRRDGGAVVNTTSSAALPGGRRGLECYGAAKAAVAALTIGAALEFAEFGARVNAIAPYAFTRMARHSLGGIDRPDGRVGGFDPNAPANNAPLVAWLASDYATHVNGQVFRVRGDTIEHFVPWQRGKTIQALGGWTVDKVAEAVNAQVFGSRVQATGTNPYLAEIAAAAHDC